MLRAVSCFYPIRSSSSFKVASCAPFSLDDVPTFEGGSAICFLTVFFTILS